MKILALGAHPDDVEVSAGGTIARFAAEGHEVSIRTLTYPYDKNTLWREANKAALTLGAVWDDWGENWTERDLVAWPFVWDLIIAPHPIYDSHPQHRNAGSLAQQIARKNNTDLWFMDHAIPGGWVADRPRPNHFVNISDYAETKYNAIKQYKQWLEKYGSKWTEDIFLRDTYYGTVIGTLAAEGFTIGFSRQ